MHYDQLDSLKIVYKGSRFLVSQTWQGTNDKHNCIICKLMDKDSDVLCRREIVGVHVYYVVSEAGHWGWYTMWRVRNDSGQWFYNLNNMWENNAFDGDYLCPD
jgi:hypothetical protein